MQGSSFPAIALVGHRTIHLVNQSTSGGRLPTSMSARLEESSLLDASIPSNRTGWMGPGMSAIALYGKLKKMF